MRRFLLTFFAVILCAASAWADDSGTCGDGLTWNFTSSTGALTITYDGVGTGAMTNWSYGSYVPWNGYRSDITSVSLPNGLTTIGKNAFRECPNLTSISIPNSVTSIGDYAFCYCNNLISISIPVNVASIGQFAYAVCSNLESVSLSQGLESIGNSAFRDCSTLTSISIPNSVTSLGNGAFYGCTGLTNVTTGNGVTSIAPQTFYGCTSLTSVTFGSVLTSIGAHAFRNCTSLTNAIFKNGLTSIGGAAFADCTGLTTIYIPNSVTSVGVSAFYGCTGLEHVYVHWSTPLAASDNVFSSDTYSNAKLYVPHGTSSAYGAVTPWSSFSNVVEYVASVTTSGDVTTEYETFADALATWETGSTLTLLSNIEISSTITVNTLKTLDLNGYGIKSTGARVISVEAGGNLTIMDSNTNNLTHKFSVNYPASNTVNAGLASLDEANGTIVIEGGYITGGNTPSYNNAYTKGGAGIRVCEGTLTLQGGTIIGNHSQSGWGGGVMVTKGGTFNMSGGAICYNRADWGSGLSMYGNNDLGAANKDGITCTVTGGSIHHNYANGGDAVHNVSNDYTVTYTMTGGSIRDNYANNSSFNRAGLHVDGIKFTCNISGNPVVINNYCSSKLRNATIEEGIITVTGPLSEANIGVWKAQTGIFATNMEGNGDISQFVSDRSDYSVALHFTGDAKLAIASSFSTTPTAKSLTYNGSAQQLVNAGTSSHGTIEYKLGDGAWGTAIPTATEADTYTVYYHIIGDANHTDNPGSSISVTINPAPLTCTADDKEVTYGDAAPEYTVSYSGWLGSDNTSAISGSLAFACDYSAGSNVGDYIITPSGVTASNYDITFNTGTLTVNKASATITSAPTPVDDLTYDGEEHSLVSAGSVSAGTMKYSLDNSDWSEAIPTASAIGTHRVYYMLDGGQNYTSVSGSLFVETTISGPRVADNADPSTTLTALYTEANPMSLLMNRTIYADGDYNTICLPFDVSESDFANPSHPLYGYERLKAFRGAQVTGSGQDLSIDVFVKDATEIVAGTPYLITYPSSHGDIVDAVFNNVLITATEPGSVSANGVTFQGMFAPVHITTYEENTTQDYLFLAANNQLAWPANDATSMRGFRAYFIIDRQVITPSMAPRNSRARIVEHTDTTTDMETVTGNPSPVTQKLLKNGQLIIIKDGVRYNAQGQTIK